MIHLKWHHWYVNVLLYKAGWVNDPPPPIKKAAILTLSKPYNLSVLLGGFIGVTAVRYNLNRLLLITTTVKHSSWYYCSVLIQTRGWVKIENDFEDWYCQLWESRNKVGILGYSGFWSRILKYDFEIGHSRESQRVGPICQGHDRPRPQWLHIEKKTEERNQHKCDITRPLTKLCSVKLDKEKKRSEQVTC